MTVDNLYMAYFDCANAISMYLNNTIKTIDHLIETEFTNVDTADHKGRHFNIYIFTDADYIFDIFKLFFLSRFQTNLST